MHGFPVFINLSSNLIKIILGKDKLLNNYHAHIENILLIPWSIKVLTSVDIFNFVQLFTAEGLTAGLKNYFDQVFHSEFI
jgi:hypothetical protein